MLVTSFVAYSNAGIVSWPLYRNMYRIVGKCIVAAVANNAFPTLMSGIRLVKKFKLSTTVQATSLTALVATNDTKF